MWTFLRAETRESRISNRDANRNTLTLIDLKHTAFQRAPEEVHPIFKVSDASDSLVSSVHDMRSASSHAALKSPNMRI